MRPAPPSTSSPEWSAADRFVGGAVSPTDQARRRQDVSADPLDVPLGEQFGGGAALLLVAGAAARMIYGGQAALSTLIAPPPGITFTFTNDPSVPVAAVGETVEYSYCGENTSDVDLEVVRVEDDRFGVLEVPEESTIVSPGETLCNTDLGLPVSYVVAPSDAGKTIVNNAVVTVRTVGAEPQAFQAADPAEVEILAAGEQVEPTTTVLPTTQLANTGASSIPLRLVVAVGMVASGWLIVFAARRRLR